MNILTRLVPYIFLGIILVVFVLGVILFSYLLILGALVGLILFTVQWIREKFFKSKQLTKPKNESRPGRTFDHHK